MSIKVSYLHFNKSDGDDMIICSVFYIDNQDAQAGHSHGARLLGHQTNQPMQLLVRCFGHSSMKK